MIDTELAADRPSGRDVLVQRVRLGDARRATRQAPPIALRIGVVPVGLGRRLTKTTMQAGQAGRWPAASHENDQAGWASLPVVATEWTDGSA